MADAPMPKLDDLHLVLLQGDQATFQPLFGGVALVTVRPGNLTGSGPASVNGRAICVDGDEKRVQVRACPYTTPTYPIAGLGTLSIAALAANQVARTTHSGRKAVLLKGGVFTAKFTVDIGAMAQPPSGGCDRRGAEYTGTGEFLTTNTLLRGN